MIVNLKFSHGHLNSIIYNIDKYLDGSSENILDKLEKLIKDEKITKELIDTYISLYPMKVYKNLYETGVVYVITQG